jgi:hypothetical protein
VRSFLALAAALLASLTLAACSGGDAVAIDPVAQAADRTSEAGSSRMVMEMSFGMSGDKFFVSAEGAMDYKRRRGWLLMDFSQLAALNPGAPEMPRLNMVFENTTAWMRVPPALAGSTGGKPWVRMSLGSPSSAFGGMQQPDPSQMLDALRGISGSVKKVGTTRVRGVETTRYTADVSLDKALAEAPPRERAAAKATLRMFGGLEKMPVDLYIDDAGRVRRMEMDYDLKSAGMAFETKVKMELFDFGTRVAFKRPPASQIADLSSLRGS